MVMGVTSEATALSNNAINSLRAFRQKDKLQKVTLQMVAKYVDDKKVADLQKMFETMDDDGNGTLSLNEMKDGLMKNNMPELAAEIEKTMSDLDNDGSGLIDYSEFLAATMSRHVYMEYDYLWQVFKNYDVSNQGRLSKDDLVHVLSGGQAKKYKAGGGEVHREIDTIFEKYDVDKSGDIDFDEFMEMMKDQNGYKDVDPEKLTLVQELKDKTDEAMQHTNVDVRATILKHDEEMQAKILAEAGAVAPGDVHVEIGGEGPEIEDKPKKVGCCGFF
jgi:Ca2+-binding EF-hand superfamily protein